MTALCFIGGWGTTEEVWRGVFDDALPASSCSPHLPKDGKWGPPTTAHFVSWLECIQDWPGVLARLATMPGALVLVGWSLGSVLALRAVLESTAEVKSKISAMVLVSGTARFCSDAAASNHVGVDPRVLAAMRSWMRRTPDAVLEEFASECAMPDGGEAVRLDWLRQARRFSADELIAGLDALAALDVRERLEEVRVPCRMLHGEFDRIVPLGSAQFVAERMAGATLEVLPGRSHALPFTAADEIARCIASVGG